MVTKTEYLNVYKEMIVHYMDNEQKGEILLQGSAVVIGKEGLHKEIMNTKNKSVSELKNVLSIIL